MKHSFIGEITASITLIVILALFLLPTSLRMPESAEVSLLLTLIVVFLIFASVVWKEQARDEREELHMLKAGRFSFLSGALILVIGIINQSMHNEVDAWLVLLRYLRSM